MQVYVTELRDDEIENVGFAHLLDLILKLEIFEDAADVGGKSLDVADQVLCDVVGIALQLLEVERRVIVEALTGTGSLIEPCIQIGRASCRDRVWFCVGDGDLTEEAQV